MKYLIGTALVIASFLGCATLRDPAFSSGLKIAEKVACAIEKGLIQDAKLGAICDVAPELIDMVNSLAMQQKQAEYKAFVEGAVSAQVVAASQCSESDAGKDAK